MLFFGYNWCTKRHALNFMLLYCLLSSWLEMALFLDTDIVTQVEILTVRTAPEFIFKPEGQSGNSNHIEF